ncbi:MAG: PEP/pyruvate-binding domain-containing protein [Planctomycetota bacterium]
MTAPPELKLIHFFGPDVPGEPASAEVLGGKGYSLARMSKAGLPVPPGFTICVACCREYLVAQSFGLRRKPEACATNWPAGLEDELRQALAWLELATGSTFGAGPKPLLVAVRSGAAVSMPGMMDTVLNVGLSPALEPFLSEKMAFWQGYRDFIRQYGETVSGIPKQVFEGACAPSPCPLPQGEGENARQQADACLAAYRKAAGRDLPAEPMTMLRESVTAVFESWNSERAVRYRARNDVRCLPGTAVSVQAMFPSQLAGVLFTEDPTSPAARRIVIEAARGLGEALVSGRVQPDIFVLERQNLAVVEKKLAEPVPPKCTAGVPPASGKLAENEDEGGRDARGTLSAAQLTELAKIGLNVEAYFGHAVDIEWGFNDGRFVLLQSRRIRGLEIAQEVPRAREEEIAKLRGLAAGRKKVAWAVHNLGETLAFPTPLTWEIIARFMSARDGFIGLYRDLGFAPSARVLKEGFLVLVAGRVYADVERAAELFFDDFPLSYNLESVGPEQLLGPPKTFNYERAGAKFLLKLPYYLVKMFRAGRKLRRAARDCRVKFEQWKVPAFLEYARRARQKDLAAMSGTELLAELQERERIGLHEFGRETLKPGFLASYYHSRLAGNLELIFGPEKGPLLAASLLRGLDGDKTVECNIALYRVAQGEISLEDFLKDFGHRAANEFELSEPRWREDPSLLVRTIENYKRAKSEGRAAVSPQGLHECQRTERQETEAGLGEVLRAHGAASLEDEIRADLRGAQEYVPYRETGKHYFMLAMALVREVLEELARRSGLGKDVYFLYRNELAQLAGAGGDAGAPTGGDAGAPTGGEAGATVPELAKQIAARKLRWQALRRMAVPEVLFSTDLEALGRTEVGQLGKLPHTDGVFAGTGVAAGSGTGPARVLQTTSEAGDLGTGYILVCPSTDPGWAPLFVQARGLIVERGGMLSHGAIVARDFGIPAVVLKDATRLIPNGATIKVDGGSGRVEIVTGKG